jgi:hypothetical protein
MAVVAAALVFVLLLADAWARKKAQTSELVLTPVFAVQRSRIELSHPLLAKTLLVAGAHRQSGEGRVAERAGFTVWYDISNIKKIVDQATLVLTVVHAKPTKPFMRLSGMTDLGWSLEIGARDIEDVIVGQQIVIDVGEMLIEAVMRHSDMVGFKFPGHRDNNHDVGFVYLDDQPTLTIRSSHLKGFSF